MNTKNIINLLIIIMVTLGLMLIFTICFYDYHIIPKQAEVLSDAYAENFIGVNRAWIDIYHGKINITEEDIEKIEIMLNGIEEGLKDE